MFVSGVALSTHTRSYCLQDVAKGLLIRKGQLLYESSNNTCCTCTSFARSSSSLLDLSPDSIVSEERRGVLELVAASTRRSESAPSHKSLDLVSQRAAGSPPPFSNSLLLSPCGTLGPTHPAPALPYSTYTNSKMCLHKSSEWIISKANDPLRTPACSCSNSSSSSSSSTASSSPWCLARFAWRA